MSCPTPIEHGPDSARNLQPRCGSVRRAVGAVSIYVAEFAKYLIADGSIRAPSARSSTLKPTMSFPKYASSLRSNRIPFTMRAKYRSCSGTGALPWGDPLGAWEES